MNQLKTAAPKIQANFTNQNSMNMNPQQIKDVAESFRGDKVQCVSMDGAEYEEEEKK